MRGKLIASWEPFPFARVYFVFFFLIPVNTLSYTSQNISWSVLPLKACSTLLSNQAYIFWKLKLYFSAWLVSPGKPTCKQPSHSACGFCYVIQWQPLHRGYSIPAHPMPLSFTSTDFTGKLSALKRELPAISNMYFSSRLPGLCFKLFLLLIIEDFITILLTTRWLYATYDAMMIIRT